MNFDHHSGGYPYASDFSAHEYTDLNKAVGDLEKECEMAGLKTPKVYEIVYKEVNTSKFKYMREKVEDIVSTLTDEEKKLLKEYI